MTKSDCGVRKKRPAQNASQIGAGDENRTHNHSLGSCCFATKLHLRLLTLYDIQKEYVKRFSCGKIRFFAIGINREPIFVLYGEECVFECLYV